jgi:hypothetical protein
MKEIEKLKDDIRILSWASQTLANHVKQQNQAIDLLPRENTDLKSKIIIKQCYLEYENEMGLFKRTLWYKLFKWFSSNV